MLKWAKIHDAEVIEMELNSQFRCNGSDGYLAWLDHTLEIRETANQDLEGIDYRFEVCESATELKQKIVERNQETGKSRIVAGYCWEWVSKKDKSKFDFNLNAGSFKAKWNLSDDGMLWIVKPSSIDEVGCIHTCQGLELDYVGGDFWARFLGS